MGGCHLPSGLRGTAHPCPRCAPLPGHCRPHTLRPSPCGARSGGRGPGITEENKRLSLSSSKSIQGGVPGAISTTGRPSASPGKGGSGRGGPGQQRTCLWLFSGCVSSLGKGGPPSRPRGCSRGEKGSLGALGWDTDIRIQPPGGGLIRRNTWQPQPPSGQAGPSMGTHIRVGCARGGHEPI